MPDPYASITEVEPEVLEILINALEIRAADPQQKRMREAYLSWVDFPEAARVLEAGCGTGAVSRDLALWPNVGEVIGLDPSPVFLTKARELAAGIPNVQFEEADARSLPYEDNAFDAVVFHTCLCHLPEPERAIEEAGRVLRPGGHLAVFDGDYTTTTFAIGDHDPLERCADAAVAALVHDRWFVRRLPAVVKSAGFTVTRFDGHGYVQTSEPDYLLTLVDRGADILVGWSRIDAAMAEALKKEARRRVESGEFFGFIAFASLIARKPG
jgi:ubiquinone/menaquinone biosynthesis C-methylase UbiE